MAAVRTSSIQYRQNTAGFEHHIGCPFGLIRDVFLGSDSFNSSGHFQTQFIGKFIFVVDQLNSLLHVVARTSLGDSKSIGMFQKAPIGQNSLTYQRYFSRIVWLEALDFSSVCCNIIRLIRKYWSGLDLRIFFVFYGKKLYWAIFTIFNIQFRFIRVGNTLSGYPPARGSFRNKFPQKQP